MGIKVDNRDGETPIIKGEYSYNKKVTNKSEQKLYRILDLDRTFQQFVTDGSINVIPLRPGTKKPAMGSWKKYQTEQYPLQKLRQHVGNFAVITGCYKKDKCLVVLDIDDNKGEDGLYRHFKDIDTLHVKTARKGFHIYFWSNKPVKKTNIIKKRFELDMELRGDSGKFVVIPPSYIQYEDGVVGCHELIMLGKDEPIETVDDPIEFVSKILTDAGYNEKTNNESIKYSNDNKSKQKNVINIGNNWKADLTSNDIEKLINLLKPVYTDGVRHDMTLYLSGWMCKAEVSYDSALKVIMGLSKNDPEQSDRIKTLEDTYKKKDQREVKGYSGIREILQSGVKKLIENHYSDIKDKSERDNKVEKLLNKLSKIIEQPGSMLRGLEALDNIKYENGNIKAAIKEIHQFMRKHFNIVNDRLSNELAIYNPNKGYYEFYDYNRFHEFLSQVFNDEIFTLDESKKLKSIFAQTKEQNKDYICFKNGILNLETLKLEEFNPEYFLTFKVPYNWNPEANGNDVEEKLRDILIDQEGDDEGDQSKYHNYMSVLGYCFEEGNPRQKIFLYIGQPNSGKTQLINLIAGIFEGSVSSVPLQQFKDRFGLQPLIGKRVNTLYDISEQEINDPSVIKAVSGNDSMTVDRKYKTPITFGKGLSIKTIGAGNLLPKINDDTGAMARRLNITKLNNHFGENPIEDLAAKLLNDQEGMEWLLYNSITQYHELKKQNIGFPLDFTPRKVEMEYLKISDPCKYAMKRLYEFSNNENDFYTTTEIITSINSLLVLEGLKIPKDTRKNHHPAIRATGGEYILRRINGDPIRGYTLIRAKNEDNDPLKTRLDKKTLIKLKSHSTLDLHLAKGNEKIIIELMEGDGPRNLAGIISDAQYVYNIDKKDTMAILNSWRGANALKIDNSAYYCD